MIILLFRSGNDRSVCVAHNGRNTKAYCFYPDTSLFFEGHVGAKVPLSWKEWNVLESWRLTAEGERARTRWTEVTK